MKQAPVNKIFKIQYGNGFSLQDMIDGDIAFVARGSTNNGISGYVSKHKKIKPFGANKITVALSGSVLETFYQNKPFYTAYHVMVLTPIEDINHKEMLLYCSFIRANKYRYNYGRQANKTISNILIPTLEEVRKVASAIDVPSAPSPNAKLNKKICLDLSGWKDFKYDDLFHIERGKGPRKKDIQNGLTPFVTSSDSNNGVTAYILDTPTHRGNVIGVNRNGSVGEAFFQKQDFCSTEDVHIFSLKSDLKSDLNPAIALFLSTVIKMEKYRFNYGRKWGIERMKKSTMKLPVDERGYPDWQFMQNYILSLPYSSNL